MQKRLGFPQSRSLRAFVAALVRREPKALLLRKNVTIDDMKLTSSDQTGFRNALCDLLRSWRTKD